MNRLSDAWASINQVGSGIYPYLGVAVVCIVVLFCLGLTLYLSYKLVKRLPPFMGYLWWAIKRLLVHTKGWMKRAPAASSDLKIRLGASGPSRPLNQVFGKSALSTDAAKPLMLLLSTGSETDCVIESAMGLTPQPHDGSGATWWSLPSKAVLQIHLNSLGKNTVQLSRLASELTHARREPPVGLVVNLKLSHTPDDGAAPAAMASLQQALQTLGEQIGYRLPLWVTITPDKVISSGLHASRILGAKSFVALMRWEATRQAETLDAKELSRSADRAFNALVATFALEEQDGEVNARDRARALRLPMSWSRLCDVLHFLHAPRSAGFTEADTFPRLQALDLLVPAGPTGLTDTHTMLHSSPPTFSEHAPWVRRQHVRPPATAHRAKKSRRRVLKSVVFAVGLTMATMATVAMSLRSIDNDARILTLAASRLAHDPSGAQTHGMGTDAQLPEGSTREVVELLRSIREASLASSGYAAIPRSWGSGPKSRLQVTQGDVLRRQFVIPRVQRLSEAIQQEQELPAGAPMPVIAHTLQDLPTFASFRRFIERRRMTLTSLDTAQELGDSASYQSVLNLLDKQGVAEALHGVDLQEKLPTRVREQLQLQDIFDEIVQKDVKEIAHNAWEKVLEEGLDQHPLLVDAEAAEKALENLTRRGDASESEVSEIARLLQKVRNGAQARDARRLLGKPSDTASFFSGGLSSLVRAGAFSAAQMAQTAESVQRHREQARHKLLTIGLPGEVRMFNEGPDGKISLTQEFFRLASAWNNMNAQPFMRLTISMPSSIPEHASGWDLVQLQSLKGLQGPLREFLDSGLNSFDPSLRPPLRRLASQRSRALARSLMLESAFTDPARLEQTTSLDPLASLRPQITNIISAANLYRQTLARDEQLEEEDPAAALLRRTAQRHLERLQAALRVDDPYASIVRDVTAWMKTSQGPLAMATTLGGPPKERLAMAREYIVSQYAANASALLEVAILGAPSSGGRDPDVQQWRRFIDAIEGFDKGSTSNGLVEFEQYVLTLGKLGRPDECQRFLADWPAASRRSDHFSQQLAALEQSVAAACEERSEGMRRRAFESFAQWFNSEIAYRFPFGAPGSIHLARASLLPMLERYAQMRSQLGNPRQWGAPVTEFLRDMDALHMLFVGPVDKAAENSMPSSEKVSGALTRSVGGTAAGGAPEGILAIQPVRFNVRLRAQEEDSDLVKHIIDAAVTIGERTVSVKSSNSALEWRAGETIEVRLRWAADSSYAPVGDAGSAYKVSGRTAVFSFSGDWALAILLESSASRQTLRETQVTLPVTVIGGDGRQQADFQLRLVDVSGSPLRVTFPKRAPMLGLGEQLTPSLRIKRADTP
jgi:hypothetical protein